MTVMFNKFKGISDGTVQLSVLPRGTLFALGSNSLSASLSQRRDFCRDAGLPSLIDVFWMTFSGRLFQTCHANFP